MQKLPSFINKNLKLLSTVITGAIIGGATTGVVVAAIPDSGGTIHGCRNNLTRGLTVVDNEAGQSCGLGTTSLNWSQGGGSGGGASFISQNVTITTDAQGMINSPTRSLECPANNIALTSTELIQYLSGDHLIGSSDVAPAIYASGYTKVDLIVNGYGSGVPNGSETAKIAVACTPASGIPQ